ncbi:hypothetical protein ACHAXH_007372 [Discostella pseudostelligera]
MFSLATGIYQSYFAPPKLSIIILGLDGSGKTALLERIKVTEITNDAATAASTTTPYLPSMYAKGGAAVAGVDDGDNCHYETMNGTQQQRRHTKHARAGGRPARLPPPLPPKQAMESRRVVEKLTKEGFYNDGVLEEPTDAAGNGNMDATTRLALERICPPPLVPISAKETKNHSSSSSENASDNNQKMKLGNKSVKSTLPPLPSSSSSSISTSSSTVAQQHANSKSTFIGLLRCPSPIKYSNAVIVDDYNDEEELLDEEPIDEPPLWDTEYLRDYYINYQEEEEFDIKQTRVGSSSSSSSGGGVSKSGSQAKKMFPLDRIRPTLGQNLATLDLRGCKCSLFDLSGAEKMRPLWERYYQDADAIIYVVNAAETSEQKLRQSRCAFERMYEHDVVRRRVRCGLPVLVFANQLDVAYQEYNDSLERANNTNGEVQQQQQRQQQKDVGQRGISWNADEEDNFIGGMKGNAINGDANAGDHGSVSRRVVDLEGLATLYGFPRSALGGATIGHSRVHTEADRGNIFFFGGSAKSGEGVRAAMEYLVTHARNYHLTSNPRR